MFSVAGAQASSWIRTPLFSNASRLLASHRAELFHFHLQDPAGSTQGCGLCYALSGPPSWCGTRAPPGLHLRPRLSGTTPTSPLTPPSPPSGTFPSLPPPRPLFVLLHPPDLIPHPAASCRREELSGKDHLPTTDSHSLGPSHIHTPSFTTQLGGNGSNRFTISLGTESRCGRIGPMSHRRQAPSLPLHCLLTFPFCSRPPIATMVLWASQASRPGRPAVLLCAVVCACTSRRRTADPFVKLVSYLQ